MRVTGESPQGTMGRVSPSRLPMRAHFHRERETSGGEAVVTLNSLEQEANNSLNIKKICLSRKCQFSPAGQRLIQALLELFEHNLSQNSAIKRQFQSTLGPISACGSKSGLGNWTVLTLI